MADPVQAVSLDVGFKNYSSAREGLFLTSPASDAFKNAAKQVVEEEERIYTQLRDAISRSVPSGKYTPASKLSLYKQVDTALGDVKKSLKNINSATTAGGIDSEMIGLNDFRQTFVANIVGDEGRRFTTNATFGGIVTRIGDYYSNGAGLAVVSNKTALSSMPTTPPGTVEPKTTAVLNVGSTMATIQSFAAKFAKMSPDVLAAMDPAVLADAVSKDAAKAEPAKKIIEASKMTIDDLMRNAAELKKLRNLSEDLFSAGSLGSSSTKVKEMFDTIKNADGTPMDVQSKFRNSSKAIEGLLGKTPAQVFAGLKEQYESYERIIDKALSYTGVNPEARDIMDKLGKINSAFGMRPPAPVIKPDAPKPTETLAPKTTGFLDHDFAATFVVKHRLKSTIESSVKLLDGTTTKGQVTCDKAPVVRGTDGNFPEGVLDNPANAYLQIETARQVVNDLLSTGPKKAYIRFDDRLAGIAKGIRWVNTLGGKNDFNDNNKLWDKKQREAKSSVLNNLLDDQVKALAPYLEVSKDAEGATKINLKKDLAPLDLSLANEAAANVANNIQNIVQAAASVRLQAQGQTSKLKHIEPPEKIEVQGIFPGRR